MSAGGVERDGGQREWRKPSSNRCLMQQYDVLTLGEMRLHCLRLSGIDEVVWRLVG